MRRYAQTLAVVALTILVMAPAVASAAWTDPIVRCTGVLGDHPCTVCDIAKTAQNLLNTAIYVAIFLSSGLFAWAGIIYVTNVANHGEINKAKTIFANVIIGLVIIMVSWLVIDTLMKTLVSGQDGTSEFGPWNQVC
ncbi:MAG: hypothetical protein Q7S01_04360 [bacterium]|nr:hypothetical protein [bacterium]